jgi:hypothetical protein
MFRRQRTSREPPQPVIGTGLQNMVASCRLLLVRNVVVDTVDISEQIFDMVAWAPGTVGDQLHEQAFDDTGRRALLTHATDLHLYERGLRPVQ